MCRFFLLFFLNSSFFLSILLFPLLSHASVRSHPRSLRAASAPSRNLHRAPESCAIAASNRRAKSQHHDVVVVGAGPVGLTTALSLGTKGTRVLVLEAATAPTQHPQAHFIHQSSTEVLRHLGVLPAVLKAAPAAADWQRFVYCRDMSSPPIAVKDHFTDAAASALERASPVSVVHLAQSKLVEILLDAADEHPNVTVRFGHRVTAVRDDPPSPPDCTASGMLDDTVAVDWSASAPLHGSGGTAAAAAAGTSKRGTVHASYLVAADGAASPVRKALRIPFDGGEPLQHLINIHFKAPGLAASNAVAGMLYFVYNKATISVVVAHDIAAGEYVAQVPYFPEFEPPGKFTDGECRRLVRAAIGNARAEVDILSVRRWTMGAGVARQFRRGRVFLAGDACHHFPPSGAFGMNTGIQDAHNLAWKLASVVANAAPASLLDSYEVERKPCSHATLDLSMANYDAVLTISAALGADPAHAKLALKLGGAGGVLGVLPDGVRTGLLSAAFAVGKGAVLTEQPTLISKSRIAKVQQMVRSGDGLELLFQHHDLGHTYPSLAAPRLREDAQVPSRDLGRTAYTPSVRVGGRLPHRWLEMKGAPARNASLNVVAGGDAFDGDGEALLLSTVDLVSTLGTGEFLLFLWGENLCGKNQSSAVAQWVKAADERTSSSCRFQVVACETANLEIKRSGGGTESTASNDGSIKLYAMKSPFSAEDVDVFKVEGGVVSAALVRPDNHVAWVSTTNDSGAALKQLDDVLFHMTERSTTV